MNVQQKVSLLVMPKWKKANAAGIAPIYIRIKIEGYDDAEVSLGCQTTADQWDRQTKRANAIHPDRKAVNKKIDRALVDLDRHFDLVQACNGFATPAAIKASYTAPTPGEDRPSPAAQRAQHLAFNDSLDKLINRFLDYSKSLEKAYLLKSGPAPERLELLKAEKEAIREDIAAQVKAGDLLFKNPQHEKTFVLILNEYLLSFLQSAFSGGRAYTTLEKNMCRKRRYIEFFQYTLQAADCPLTALRVEMADDFKNYCLIHHRVKDISATKLIQFFKEMVARALAKQWISVNVFTLYKCRYKEPEVNWPTMEEMMTLKDWGFSEALLNETRDCGVFQSFTGLSYEETFAARPTDILRRDGQLWIIKDRRKTGNEEAVPLLPIAADLIEKYARHSQCLRTGKLLPVPSNQVYNRRLKQLGKECPIPRIRWRTHEFRYFFANEVTFNNGVALKTVSKMLSHSSVRTTEKYVRPNKRNISESMKLLQEKLFDESGQLKKLPGEPVPVSEIATTVKEEKGGRLIRMAVR